MKRLHFETLKPVCPVCLHNRSITSPIGIRSLIRETGDTVIEGLLACTNPECLSEFPIIDGIPIIVPDLRSFISQSIYGIYGRTDLSPEMESLLGDCCGPGSPYDLDRYHLSTYTFDHYGDLDPVPDPNPDAEPGSIVTILDKGLERIAKWPAGPMVDLGASVGRTTFEIAARTDQPVLGLDMNMGMLRVAQGVLNRKSVRHPRRRVGLVYDRREFDVSFEGMDRVDFWACDASRPPFPPGRFALAMALNLIDCVHSPYELLQSIGRLLSSDGMAMIAAPYDWSTSASPVEVWLGGHSQRSEARGASEAAIRYFLSENLPGGGVGLRIESEIDNLPWSVRLHDRGVMRYRVHLITAKASGAPPKA